MRMRRRRIDMARKTRNMDLSTGVVLFAVLSPQTEAQIYKMANDTRNFAITGIRGAKTGRTYPRGKMTHTASAPGEPPAVDTGIMLANIVADKITKNDMAVGVPNTARTTRGTRGTIATAAGVVRRRLKYPAILENGGGRIQARAWLRPAVEAATRKPPKKDLDFIGVKRR